MVLVEGVAAALVDDDTHTNIQMCFQPLSQGLARLLVFAPSLGCYITIISWNKISTHESEMQ